MYIVESQTHPGESYEGYNSTEPLPLHFVGDEAEVRSCKDYFMALALTMQNTAANSRLIEDLATPRSSHDNTANALIELAANQEYYAENRRNQMIRNAAIGHITTRQLQDELELLESNKTTIHWVNRLGILCDATEDGLDPWVMDLEGLADDRREDPYGHRIATILGERVNAYVYMHPAQSYDSLIGEYVSVISDRMYPQLVRQDETGIVTQVATILDNKYVEQRQEQVDALRENGDNVLDVRSLAVLSDGKDILDLPQIISNLRTSESKD